MVLHKLLDDIFNNLFKFNGTNIPILFDKNDTIWLSFNNVLKALGYTDIKKLKKRLDLEDTYFSTYETIYPQSKLNKLKLDYQKPNEKYINEPGIYLLLSQSSKKLAKELSKLLFTDVLPELRKRGKFILSKTEKQDMNKLTKKIKLYQKELIRTQKKSYSNITGNGFIYVLKINTIYNGENKVCHKIGYTSNLEKRLATYKTGNPDVELVHQENLKCNKQQLEKCIMNLNVLKQLKNKTEVLCDVSLSKIKDEIKDCKKLLDKYS